MLSGRLLGWFPLRLNLLRRRGRVHAPRQAVELEFVEAQLLPRRAVLLVGPLSINLGLLADVSHDLKVALTSCRRECPLRRRTLALEMHPDDNRHDGRTSAIPVTRQQH